MATYPVVHQETGEKKEVSMSVHDWDQCGTIWADNQEFLYDKVPVGDPTTLEVPKASI